METKGPAVTRSHGDDMIMATIGLILSGLHSAWSSVTFGMLDS
jgi:hypothetical protein